jgi:BlaI family transcriptional regulator, penicillinase repressor
MKLSEYEMDVMQLFWQHEPCTATHIYQLLCEQTDRRQKVAYTTLKTIVDRLEKKGAIERHGRQGRAIVYQSLVTQSTLSKQATPGFMRRFFRGDSRNFIAHFIENEKLNDDDIAYLQALLDSKKDNK